MKTATEKNTLTFRHRLLALVVIALIAFFVLGGITYNLIENIQEIHKAELKAKTLEELSLRIRKNEKDFLSQELTNPSFFETGKSKILTKFEKHIDSAQITAKNLKQNSYITKAKLNHSLDSIFKYYKNYSSKFSSLVRYLKRKGFKDYGTIGQMRVAIHEVEDYIIKMNLNPSVRVYMLTLRRHEKDYLLRKDLKYKQKFLVAVKEMNASIRSSALNPAVKLRLLKLIQNYEARFFNVIALDTIIGLNDESGIRLQLSNEAKKIEHNLRAVTKQLAATSELKIRNSMLGLDVTLILGTFLILFLSRYIIRRIQLLLGGEPADVAKIAESISKGNLDIKIKKKAAQTGVMKSMRDMLGQLQSLAKSILMVSEMISSVSNVMNQKSDDLSNVSNQQAAAAEELLSSMEQMVANIEQNNQNAKATEKLSMKAASDVKALGSAASDSTRSVEQISKKIAVIDEIVVQTNLLALNASIVAAKAGEKGKSFNVIASEVQKLAQKSQSEADEIDKLSKLTVFKSNQASQMVGKIIQDISKTSELVQQISYAGNEQNIGTKQVNTFIHQLNTAAQHNASASTDLLEQSAELDRLSEKLKKNVRFFKVS